MLEILAGATLLDKLPWWLAVPLGLAAGSGIGYWVASSKPAPGIWLAAAVALGAVLWLGLSPPRPTLSDSHSQAGAKNTAPQSPGDAVL